MTGEGANECTTTMYLAVVADLACDWERSCQVNFYAAVPSTVDRYSLTGRPGADHARHANGGPSLRDGPDLPLFDGKDDDLIEDCIRSEDAMYEVFATVEVGADVRGICRGCLHEAGLGLLEEGR